jgi:hypothetical protein
MGDFLVSAFRDLCDREGGYKAVAARISANDQSLYQIYAGVRLPSGNPKGVGPKLRKALDDAYPGWSSSRVEKQRVRPDVLKSALRQAGWEILEDAKVGDHLAILPAWMAEVPTGFRIDMLLRTPDHQSVVVEFRAPGRPVQGAIASWAAKNPADLIVASSADELLQKLLSNPKTGSRLKDVDFATFPPPHLQVNEPQVAQRMSYLAETVQTLTWGELKMQRNKLPREFWVTLEDDGLAPRAPAGTKVKFERREPRWGDAVLLRDATGTHHARVYRQHLEHGWEAFAPSGFLATFHGGMPEVVVVAVLDAIAGGWAQLSQ